MKRFARPEAVVFLSFESSGRPMHFSAMQLFRPPQDSGREFARNTYEAMRAHRDVAPAYAGHPAMRGVEPAGCAGLMTKT